MPTLDYLTGFNHRRAPTTADDIFQLGGGIAIDTTLVRYTGGTSLALTNSAGQLAPGAKFLLSTTGATAVGVFYFSLSAVNASFPLFGFEVGTTPGYSGNNGAGVNLDTTSGKLIPVSWGVNYTSYTAGGPTIVANTWYRCEVKVNATANPWLLDVSVALADATPATSLTQASVAVAANTFGIVSIGGSVPISFGPVGQVLNITDIATSLAAVDYPIGPVTIRGYSPDGVGTHNLDASTSAFFFKEVSAVDTALTTAETTSYQTIDDMPLSADVDAIWIGTAIGAIQTPTIRAWGTTAFSATNVANGSLAPGAPTGKASSDGLILIVASTSNTFTVTTPTGWTLHGSAASGTAVGGKVFVYGRIADGTATDTPSVTVAGLTTGNSGTPASAVIGAYTNLDAVTLDVAITSSDLSAQTTTSVIPARTTVTDKSLVIGIALKMLESSGQTSTVATFTERVDQSTTSGIGFALEVSDLVKTPAGSSGTATVTWSATTSARAFTVSLALKATVSITQPTNTWYAEYSFADESTIATAPFAIRALVAQNLDTATTSTWVAKLFDANQGTNSEDISNGSISTNTKTYAGKTFSQRPNTGGVWTLTAFNALRLRFGFTAAASGHPRLEGAMMEAAFSAVTATHSLIAEHPSRRRHNLHRRAAASFDRW